MKKEDPFIKLDALKNIYGKKVVAELYEKARLTMKVSDSVRQVEMQLYQNRRNPK